MKEDRFVQHIEELLAQGNASARSHSAVSRAARKRGY